MKDSNFFVIIKMIFGTFGAQIGPHILLQMPYKWLFYLWDTQMATYHDLKQGNEFSVPEKWCRICVTLIGYKSYVMHAGYK